MASEWDTHDDFNDSLYEPQYQDDNASGRVNLDHCRLYIRNIPLGLNEEGLRTAFSKYGTLTEVHLSKDPHKKYALIKFETPGEAKLAMMKMNNTEPLRLNINIAHKSKSKKSDDRPRRERPERYNNNNYKYNNSSRDDRSYREDSHSVASNNSRAQRPRVADTAPPTNNGDNSMDLIDDDYGFAEAVDPDLSLELETLKMEQLKVKEEQIHCRQRILMLKQQDRRPLNHSTMSNRCVLPDGKIVVRSQPDRSADLDQSAGAGDSRMPALQRESARECVACGAAADSFCARCGLTPYCSPTCQKRDWADRHRAVCHNLVRLGGVVKEEVQAPVVEHQPKIQNPAPLRRPHAIADTQQERPRRNEDTNSRVSDGNKSSVNFRRLQDRAGSQNSRSTSKDAKKPIAARNDSNQNSPQHKKQAQNNTKKQEADTPVEDKPPKRPFFKPAPSQPVTKASIPTAKAIAETSAAKPEPKVDKPTLVPKTHPPPVSSSQMNGNKQVPAFKAATVSDVTPVKKRVPNRYLVEELSIGDVVILSVDAKASDCKSSTGDFVCLSLHDKYCASYQMLCEDYVVDCDADNEQYKITPGDTCSYFNPTDEGWYRARCLNPTTLALIDYSAIVSVSDTDKIRQLTAKYQALPEFCCVLEAKDVQLKDNLNCTLEAKLNDGYKVSIQNVETGAALGHGIITRWLPPVEYVTAKTVIPEISRPSLLSGSRVLLVDATSAERGFVRPADAESRRAHDDVVHRALLAGRNATPLSQPPHKGQTVLSLFSDGLHYRALCKRTNVAQNKYLLEYIEYGNVEVCRDLSTMFVCPPELELSAKPTLVSMIKLTAETGEFTPPAIEYIEKLKNDEDELILTLPNGQSTAPSGSEAILKIAKNGEIVNKKVTEMCTPEWKKFQDRGGDVVEIEPLMFSDIECRELPEGPIELDVLDASLLERGLLSGCTKGDPHAEYVFTTLTSKMAEYCNSELGRQPYLPKLEELCIAQFPPYPQWCRAVVMEQPSGAGGAEVKLWSLDCGALQLVPVSLLRKMLPEFVVDIPAVVNHLEIKGFPKDVTISPECIEAGLKHLRVDQDGRGVLRVRQCTRESDGYYIIDAPDLLQAMGL